MIALNKCKESQSVNFRTKVAVKDCASFVFASQK